MKITKRIAGIFVVIGITGFLLLMNAVRPAWSESSKGATAEKLKVGILPFDSGSAGPFSYLAPAIESMVGSRLSSPDRIAVVSPSEIGGLSGLNRAGITEDKKKTLAAKLGLSYFVTGRVFKGGGKPEVDLALVPADSDVPVVSRHIGPSSLDAISPGVEDFVAKATDAVLHQAGPNLSEVGKEKQETPISQQPSAGQTPSEAEAAAASRMHPERLIKRHFGKASTPAESGGKEETRRTEAIVKGAENNEIDLAPFPPPPSDSVAAGTAATSGARQTETAAPVKEERHKGWLSWITRLWKKEEADKRQPVAQQPTPEERRRTEAIVKGAEDDKAELAPLPPPTGGPISTKAAASSGARQTETAAPAKEGTEKAAVLRLPEPPAQEERHKGWLSWITGLWRKEGADRGQPVAQQSEAPKQPASTDSQNPPDKSKASSPAPTTDAGPLWQWY